ncbi:flagellar basal body P-ring formation protein FlgA [Aliivibrio fischeri]|nr:flagellar basal body P-ring formation chaperone FlgA [Aliivibrio fischeri]MUK40742.1 flagellar basal body P-ring formation protein FlgA [Aliivibrio fischeri]
MKNTIYDMAFYIENMMIIKKCDYRTTFYRLISIIGLFISFFSSNVHAATDEQLDAIKHAAESFLQSQIEVPQNGTLHIEAARIDSRIQATDCPAPLIASLPGRLNSSGNTSVLVECQPDDWKVYVPVKTELMMPLVTAISSLSRGHTISSSDLTLTMVNSRTYQRGGYINVDDLVGARIKRSVRAGETVEKNDICMVCRNDSVIIKAVKGELSIITKGTALGDGALGDKVNVKNDKSNRIVNGIVTSVGEISIRF